MQGDRGLPDSVREPGPESSPAQLEILCAIKHLCLGQAPGAAESLEEPVHVVGGRISVGQLWAFLWC